MKIVSNRKSEQEEQWRNEYTKRANQIKSTVEQYLSEFKLQLRVDVIPQSFGLDGYEVNIYCNDMNTPDSEDAALSWDYHIGLDVNGYPQMSSGSWSGLKAVTRRQISNLKESVRCIEFIRDMDWKNILSVRFPKYEEFES